MPRQDLRTRRESLGLTLREVSRRTGWSETSRQGINPGRLSIIERGVTPTLAEHTLIEDVLVAEEQRKP